MTEIIRLKWLTDISEGSGNQYGYFVHNTELRNAVSEQLGLVEENPTDVIMITGPEYFKEKIPGVRTWLFTMFEGTTIPKIYEKNMAKADCLLAPSTWVAELFKKYFPQKPIFVIPHGVSKQFTFKKRRPPKPGKVFRFLWVGAPNPRKGYEEASVVWQEVFSRYGNLQLYMKTTGPEKWKYSGRLVRKGNVILDGRKISTKELVKLYHSAHCFLFPTRGEGFGLTLAEAMKTGLPCISTYYSGLTDFFDERVGYTVSHRMDKGKITFVGERLEEETMMAYPSPDELAERMTQILTNYKEALKLGRRAANRMKVYTWQRSARLLIEALEEVANADV